MQARFRSVLQVLLLVLLACLQAAAQYLGKTTYTCGNCIIPDNSCNSRPNQSAACSATNVGSEQAIPTGTTMNVFIRCIRDRCIRDGASGVHQGQTEQPLCAVPFQTVNVGVVITPESVGEKVMKIGVSGKRATFMENEPGERRLKFRSLKLLVG